MASKDEMIERVLNSLTNNPGNYKWFQRQCKITQALKDENYLLKKQLDEMEGKLKTAVESVEPLRKVNERLTSERSKHLRQLKRLDNKK